MDDAARGGFTPTIGELPSEVAATLVLSASHLVQIGEDPFKVVKIARHGVSHGYYASRDLIRDAEKILAEEEPASAPPAERPAHGFVNALCVGATCFLVGLGVNAGHAWIGVAEQLGDGVQVEVAGAGDTGEGMPHAVKPHPLDPGLGKQAHGALVGRRHGTRCVGVGGEQEVAEGGCLDLLQNEPGGGA